MVFIGLFRWNVTNIVTLSLSYQIKNILVDYLIDRGIKLELCSLYSKNGLEKVPVDKLEKND